MKILVIQQKMIGDVLLSSIICDNLRKAYPNAQIDYLVNSATTPVLEGNQSISNLIIFGPEHQSIRGLVKLGMQLRRTRYDVLIDAYSKLQSWALVLMSGAKRKISYKKIGRTFIYTDNIPLAEFPATNLGLAIERRLSLLEPLELIIELETAPKLFVSAAEQQQAKQLFKQKNVDAARKTVMISLLGSEPLKTYPLEYMAKLVDDIGTHNNVNILFNYMPKQLSDAKTVYDQCSEETKGKIYFDLLGGDLRSFIAIMNECDLIFGNDGGAINIAKALGKPSFIIFSPWIEKKIWATFEDGYRHVSEHLNDHRPELFDNKSYDDLKDKALVLYPEFTPALILPKLRRFISNHVR